MRYNDKLYAISVNFVKLKIHNTSLVWQLIKEI